MNLLGILSRVIDTGVTRVRTTTEAIGARVSGYSRIPPTEDNDDDIEMYGLGIRNEADLFGGMPSIYADHGNTHQPLQYSRVCRFLSCVTIVFQRFSMIIKSGSRYIQAIRNTRIIEILRVQHVFLILTVIALITLAARLLGLEFFDSDQNAGKLHNTSLTGLTGDQQHHVIRSADFPYVPGFYIVPVLQMAPNVLSEACTTAPSVIHSTSLSAMPTASSETASAPSSTLEKRNGIEPPMVFHHAYPLHAGRIYKSDQVLRIKLQLEHCANNMLRKLSGQGLEITSGFEFALHDCKSAIDTALKTLYPSIEARGKDIELSTAIYGVVPRGTRSNLSEVSNLPHSSKVTNLPHQDSCSKNLCSWVSPTNLDRCYHRNETDLALNGKHSYTNDSVDDFKPNAPLECNLCLPSIDKEEIAIHCKEVSVIETDLFRNLTIALGVFVAVMLVMVLLRVRWRKYGRVGRGRRLDNSMIGRPVRIPGQGEGIEGAFENPRPAPLPPKA